MAPTPYSSTWYLAGLGGGILSRLTRLVYTQRLPTDYGAYWVPLFLASALGGLAALCGVLVLRPLLEAKLVGQTLKPLLYPPGVYGLGVALGFSERLFQGLVRRLQKKIEEEGSGTKPEGASDRGSPS